MTRTIDLEDLVILLIIHTSYRYLICLSSLKSFNTYFFQLQYDVAVDEEKVKFALKTALQFGQILSGKSKREFVREIKPYMQIVSDLSKHIKLADFIRF